MSLIHDALKKAENKDKEIQEPSIGSGISSMGQITEDIEKTNSKRTYILAGVLVLVLIIVIYIWLKPDSGDETQPAKTGTEQTADSANVNVGILKKRAIEAYRADNYPTAWSTLQSAVNMDGSDPELWNNMGLIAKKRGDIAKAKECYGKALALSPNYPETMNNLAIVYMNEGNFTKAKELLENALKLVPAYVEANFNLAYLYDTKGDSENASKYYKRFLEVGGNYSSSVVDSVRDRIMEIDK